MEGNDKLKSSKWKVLHKNKKSQIWTKNVFFECFRLKFEKLVSYLKSTLSNLSKRQTSSKTTTITATTEMGPKLPYFGIFGVEF